MSAHKVAGRVLHFAALACCLLLGHAARAGMVSAERTPNRGIQPQAVVDSANILHLIYYTGGPSDGDIYYVTRDLSRGSQYSAPIRVNSQPRSNGDGDHTWGADCAREEWQRIRRLEWRRAKSGEWLPDALHGVCAPLAGRVDV